MNLLHDPEYWKDDWAVPPKKDAILYLWGGPEIQDECPNHTKGISDAQIHEMFFDKTLQLTIVYYFCPRCGEKRKVVM